MLVVILRRASKLLLTKNLSTKYFKILHFVQNDRTLSLFSFPLGSFF